MMMRSALCLALVCGACAIRAAGVGVGDSVAAVWKERHVEFFYAGRTARYSCDGLRDKVRAMLLDLGARRDLRIAELGCVDDGRLHSPVNPRLSITFTAPALPDPAVKPLGAREPSAVPARFESFTITSDTFRNLGIGDCELVQEFARQILPKLATHHVQGDFDCMPRRSSGSRFLVKGKVLRRAAASPRLERRREEGGPVTEP